MLSYVAGITYLSVQPAIVATLKSNTSRKLTRFVSVGIIYTLHRCVRFSSAFPSSQPRRGGCADMRQKRDERFETHLFLQTKYRELRDHFKKIRQRYVLIECAWCMQRVRWQRKDDASPVHTSHSICPRCFASVSKEIGPVIGFVQYTAESVAAWSWAPTGERA
jgi:hypothetical protein